MLKIELRVFHYLVQIWYSNLDRAMRNPVIWAFAVSKCPHQTADQGFDRPLPESLDQWSAIVRISHRMM